MPQMFSVLALFLHLQGDYYSCNIVYRVLSHYCNLLFYFSVPLKFEARQNIPQGECPNVRSCPQQSFGVFLREGHSFSLC